MAEPPAGTVTFVFTDIEGSTRLWESDAADMKAALERHDELLARALVRHGGYVFKHTGDGMCAAFGSAAAALAAAVDAQLALSREPWRDRTPIRVRMGIHTGPGDPVDGDYFGAALNRCARVMSAAHGAQIVCTAATHSVVEALTAPIELRDLGTHRLRDLTEPQQLYQVAHPDLERDFPALRTLDVHRHNLPIPRTTFVGRGRELSDLVEAIGAHRFVTVTGAGGSGKTRLALHAAADQVSSYADGVFFVELGSLSEPGAIASQVADTIGVSTPGVASDAIVEQFFARKRALLILDNCEHLLDAAAALCDVLLSACSELAIIATSREPLGVPGEVVQRIPSLGVAADVDTAAAVAQSEAGQLFVDRARAVQPGFAVTAANAPAIGQICRRLDGIPLAIELAAARVRHLSPQQITERLDDRFRLLTGGVRTALPRQQTLQAALDWSFDLLTPEEQMLLRRLAVFVGRFPLAAAEAVCSDDVMDRITVVDLLGRLVDRSLVVAEPGPDECGYRLLETVRHYAQSRLLAADEAAAMRDRHRSWFAGQARAVFGGRTYLVADRPAGDSFENLLAALQWAVATEAGTEALALLGPLCESWVTMWRRDEADYWLSVVLDAPWTPDCAERALVASFHAGLASMNGDFTLGLARVEEALEYATARGYDEVVPDILWTKAIAASVVRGIDEGVALLDEAAARGLGLGLSEFAAGALATAATYRLGRDIPRALADLERAVTLIGTDRRDRVGRLTWLTLALARMLAGDAAGAAAALAVGTPDGDADRAAAVAEVSRGAGDAELLVPLAVVLAATGAYDQARAAVATGRRRVAEVPVPLVDTAYLVASGAVEVFGGDPDLGMRLLGAARRCFGQEGAWRAPVVGAVYVRACARARQLLGDEAARQARERGIETPREEAHALVE